MQRRDVENADVRRLTGSSRKLAIERPIEAGLEPIVSFKDAAAATFADCEKYS